MTIPYPPDSRRDPDDLAVVRAADRLNTWLDAGGPVDDAAPPLAATTRETARLAATGVPTRATRAHEDRLWEDLMRQHLTPSSRPAALPASSLVLAAPAAASFPGRRDVRPRPPAHPFGRRVMGMVATLTLVALVGLSAVAVSLNAPRDPAPPSNSLAGAVLGTPSAGPFVPPSPVRADAYEFPGPSGWEPGDSRIWGLPDTAFNELPAADSYGEGWHSLAGVTLVQQPDTAFQIETRYYVDGNGSRIRIMLVRYVDDAQFDAAYAYFADEVRRYQDTVYSSEEPGRAERLQHPLEGCDRVMRAEGLEWVTSFQVLATLCAASDPGVVMLVSFNGRLGDLGLSTASHVSDQITVDALTFMEWGAAPIATP